MAAPSVSPAEVGVEIGSIFSASWGYDQTNVDFFKVVGLTAKGVKVVKIGQKRVESPGGGHFTYEHVVPDPDHVIGRSAWDVKEGEDPMAPVTKRLKAWTSHGKMTVAINFTSYADAYLWDGKPEFQTAAGFGH